MDTKRLLSSKPVLILLLAGVALLANFKYRQWQDQQAILKEKNTLIAQQNSLEQKNQQLSQSLAYLNTDSFKERIARQQLNLKRDGEIVYTFTEGQEATSEPETEASTQSSGSNVQQWWQYFFGQH